jgi:hypothetical protein
MTITVSSFSLGLLVGVLALAPVAMAGPLDGNVTASQVMQAVSPQPSMGLAPGLSTMEAPTSPSRGRLSRLIQDKPKLYLPSRLVMGEPNTVVLRAPAGQFVRVIVTQGQLEAPDAKPSDEQNILFQTEAEEIPAKGVLGVALPVPNNKDLDGITVFVTAELSNNKDFKATQALEWVDSSGQKTSNNGVSIVQPTVVSKGPSILPNMPGMNPQLMRQINSVSQLQNGSTRQKQLIDDGNLNRNSAIDRNSFITRPGLPTGGSPAGGSASPLGF